MDFDKLKKARALAKAAITRIANWVKANQESERDFEMFESRIEGLREAYHKYNEIQDNIEINLTELANGDTEDRDLIENQFHDLLCKLQKAMKRLKPANTTVTTPSQPVLIQQSSSMEVKLPQITIKPFKGCIAEWQPFIQLFTALVIENKNLSDIQKFIYLKSFLRDEPLNLVDSLPVTNENFDSALKILTERYENKITVINTHLVALFEVPPLTKHNAVNLREFVTNCKKHLCSLTNLKYSYEELFEFLTIYLLSKKIDFATQKAFESERDLTELPTIEEFFDFLEKRCLVLENIASREVPSATKGNKPTDDKRHEKRTVLHGQTDPKNSGSSTGCTYCNDNSHKIYSCVNFKKLQEVEKANFVKAQRLCFNCLTANHAVPNCPSTKTCSFCSQKHNSLLHASFTYQRPPGSYQRLPQGNYNNRSGNNQNPPRFPHDRNPQPPNNPIQNKNSNSQNSRGLNGQNQNQNSQNGNQRQTQFNNNPVDLQNSQVDNNQSNRSISALCTKNKEVLLATACVTLYDADGQPVQAKAILDNGSQNSFITEKLVKKLNYVSYVKNTHVSGIAMSNNISKKMVDIVIHSNVYDHRKFRLSCAILPVITGHLPAVKINSQSWPIPSRLPLADPKFSEPSDVDLLIGSELYYTLLIQGMLRLGRGLPTMMNTHLGWVLGGMFVQVKKSHSHLSVDSPSASVSLFVQNEKENPAIEPLTDILKKFWAIEELPTKIPLSLEDEFVEKVFKDTTKVLTDGSFQVNLPLKSPSENSKLGDSLAMARKRFLNLEKKFVKHSEYYTEYKKFIDEYVDLGHAHYVPLSPTDDLNQSKYFLPHHAVIKEDSTTTKLRVVFDASCKTTSGICLNDITYKGYQVHPDLYDILLRFRSFKLALTTDIEKMFRQIKVNPEQTFLLNILWRDSPDKPLECIELTTVTYGTNCAPFLASRVIKEVAEKIPDSFPLASEALLNQCYVDDILSGADNIDDLQLLHNQLNESLNTFGFKLHKWCSNSESFLNTISEEKIVEVDFNLEDTSNKVLGLKWNPANDSFCISIPEISLTGSTTKRKILSIIAQCYDPLGFLSPIIITGKLIMQELWKKQLDWDDPISDTTLLNVWNEFFNNLPLLKTLKIPRYFFENKSISKIEFHGFCDASERAYSACVYARTFYNDNTISCHLLSSKSRVAPVNTLTLPRLELCAMLLLANLVTKLIFIFESRFEINSVHLWSDSQISLCWINSHASRWSVFVANRVSKIQSLTNNFQWYHVRSAENPADFPSRGIPILNLQDCKMWWQGPDFLHDLKFTPSDQKFQIDDTHLEEKRKTVLVALNPSDKTVFWSQVFERFSSYQKLLRTVAYILRFIFNIQRKGIKSHGVLSVDELTAAQTFIVQILQSLHFPKELQQLQTSTPIRDKNITKLNPILDDNGLIRVGGRLAHADIPYDQKHPILLPSHNKIVSLMLAYEHKKLGHAGAQNVLSSFRLRFWPLNGLKESKRLINKCINCFRFKAQPATQIMAQLPKDRVNVSRVFSRVGIDYGGPFFLKSSNLRKAPLIKCYIAIFVCMVTKAIHIELVTELSTNGFIKTLKRFIARRGNPNVIYSDNATNFVGAQIQLKEMYRFFQNKETADSIKEFLSLNEIEFKFIPPRSPHWGGIWESAIKSAKYHLSRLIGESHFTFEDFYTILVQIEAILNSRPLCTLSNDPNDLQGLTPGHFLIQSSLTAYPDKDVSEVPINRLSLYERIQQIQQLFWKRWSVDYLNRLQHRPKWFQPTENLKVDSIVLLKDELEYPLKWPLARIVEVIPGSDNKVRAVKLKTKQGVFTRSISKVCPLPEEGSWNLEEVIES